MKDKLKLALRAAVSIAILGYLGSSLDWRAVRNLEPSILAIIFGGAIIFFLAQCIMSFRWKLILDRATDTATSYPYLVRTYTIAQFFNLLMPGSIGGDVVRAISAAETYRIPRARSFSIVISERFFGLAAICIFVAIGFVAYPTRLSEIHLEEYFALVAAIGAVVAFFVARHLANRSSKIPLATAMALLVISASAQLADVVITFLLAKHFQLEIGITELLIVVPIVYFATILPISVGGLGVREGAMVALLATFAVDETTAIIIAFTLYLTKFTVGLFGGLLYLKSGRQTAHVVRPYGTS